MSLAEWQEYRALDRQVRDLEKQQRQAAGSVQNSDWYQYRVSPTCPPSTSIYVHGGWCWTSPTLVGNGWFYKGDTYDIADDSLTYPDYIFTNPYWYMPCTVGFEYGQPDQLASPPFLWLYGRFPPQSYGGGLQEFETASEAEANIDEMLNDGLSYSQLLPICQLILRNNGNTVNTNQFQPIDRINRGRSYLYGGELRTIYRI